MVRAKYVAKLVGQDVYIKPGYKHEETINKKEAAIMSWEGIEVFVRKCNMDAVKSGSGKRYEVTYL